MNHMGTLILKLMITIYIILMIWVLTKSKKEKWRKRAFESKLPNIYGIEIQNGMTFIHENEVNKRAQCNFLYYIINPYKCTKNLNVPYSPTLHGCVNTQHYRAKFQNFRILLDIGCGSTIVMGRLFKNFLLKRTLWCSGTRKRVVLLPI